MENEIENQQTTPTTENSANTLNTFLTRRNIIAGIVIIVIISICAVLLLRLPNKKTSDTNKEVSMPAYGQVYLSPSEVDATINTPQSVDIYANSGGKAISGILISIKYNSLLFTNVELSQLRDAQSAFSSSLVQDGNVVSDTKNGTIYFSLKLPPTTPAYSVNGKVAKLTFTPKPLTVAITSTPITLMSNTAFTFTNSGAHNQIQKKSLLVIYQHLTIPTQITTSIRK